MEENSVFQEQLAESTRVSEGGLMDLVVGGLFLLLASSCSHFPRDRVHNKKYQKVSWLAEAQIPTGPGLFAINTYLIREGPGLVGIFQI